MAVYVTNVNEDYADVAGREMKLLVGGTPGAGKTLFASTWPNPLYLDAEGRLLSIRHKPGIKRVRITSIHDVEEVRNMLDQDPEVRARNFGGRVDTVVIDTIDEVARLAQQDRLRSERRETFSMADWGWYGDFLRALCRGFRNLDGLNVIFNVHLKTVEDGESGKIMFRPDISGSVGNEIASYVDEALLLVQRLTVDPATGDRTSVRVLQSYPDPAHDWVKDHSGVLAPEMQLNFVDDGRRILDLVFDGSAPAPQPTIKVEASGPVETSMTSEEMAPEEPVEERPAKRPSKKAKAESRPDVPTPSGVPEKGTDSATGKGPFCAKCGALIEDRNVAEISEIRFGETLCRADFNEARQREQVVTK